MSKNELHTIIKEMTVFLDSHYGEPTAGPKISELLESYDRRDLEAILSRFLVWILLQKLPFCRKPLETPGMAREVMHSLIVKSPDLTNLFRIESESIDFRVEVSPEVRDEVRSIVRELYNSDISE